MLQVKVTPTFALFRGGEKVHSHGGINETNLHRVGGGPQHLQSSVFTCHWATR